MTLPASWVNVPIIYAGDSYPSGAALARKRIVVEGISVILASDEAAFPGKVTLVLNSDGELDSGTTLPTVDDEQHELVGVYYKVTERWTGGRTFTIFLPYSETPAAFNLATAAPQVPPVDLADTRGPAGLSAYQIAVADGFEGTEAEWLLSLHGDVTPEALAAQAAAEAAQAAAETAQAAAAGSASSAGTSATAAGTSETNAGSSAAAAASSATSASGSASTATTKAAEASTSASNAASSADAAATSETNAGNSASAASTSATNAGIAATAAGTSETNAAGSASSASDSAAAAAALIAGTALLRHGTGAPSDTLGNDGDYYLDDTAPKTLYGPKAAGAWPAGVSLQGDAGTNATITVYTDEAAFDAATPGASELAVLTDA